MEAADLVPVVLVLAAGALIQAAAGFGMGLFAIPLLLGLGLSSWVAIPITLATVVLQSIFGLSRLHHHVDWRGLLRIAWVPVVSMPFGVMIQAALARHGPDRVGQVYGAVILGILSLRLLWRVRPVERVPTGWTLTALLASGIMSGSAGMGGPPIVLWVTAHGWTNERSRATLWLFFLCMAPILACMLWVRFGSEVPRAFGLGLLLAPGALLGFVPGMWLGRQLAPHRLRLLAHAILLAVSLKAILEPWLRAL